MLKSFIYMHITVRQTERMHAVRNIPDSFAGNVHGVSSTCLRSFGRLFTPPSLKFLLKTKSFCRFCGAFSNTALLKLSDISPSDFTPFGIFPIPASVIRAHLWLHKSSVLWRLFAYKSRQFSSKSIGCIGYRSLQILRRLFRAYIFLAGLGHSQGLYIFRIGQRFGQKV